MRGAQGDRRRACLPLPAPLVEHRRPARATLTSNAAGLAFGSLFTQAAQILTLSVLARLVAKDQIATYQQMNLVYGMASPLLLAGVPAALLYFVPRAALPEDDATRGWCAPISSSARWASCWPWRSWPPESHWPRSSATTSWRPRSPGTRRSCSSRSSPPWLRPRWSRAGMRVARRSSMASSEPSTMICVVVAALVSPTGVGLAVALSASGAVLAVASVVDRPARDGDATHGSSPRQRGRATDARLRPTAGRDRAGGDAGLPVRPHRRQRDLHRRATSPSMRWAPWRSRSAW